MQILPISTDRNDAIFKARRKLPDIINKPRPPKVREYTKRAEALSLTLVSGVLAAFGIKDCFIKDDTINISRGRKGGYYTFKNTDDIADKDLKYYVAGRLHVYEDAFGGICNYMDLVDDVKRQDILQKGLKIHTYELNTNVNYDDALAAAKILTKQLNRTIKMKDLFFIEKEAYYYNKDSGIAYAISTDGISQKFTKPVIRKCEFIKDDKKNVIGYKTTDWDLFTAKMNEVEYREQQEPSEKLPEIIHFEDNKRMAEGFRFGNTKNIRYRAGRAIEEKIIPHLRDRVKIENITKDKLNYTKFYNKDNEVVTRISYYDPDTGNSIVYNEEGKYLYQMEYIKNPLGTIIAANRL